MIKKEHELKKLYSMKSKLDIDFKLAQEESRQHQRACAKIKNKIESLVSEINDMENSDVIVTEHAILRYLERSIGVDIEGVKKEILNDETALLICKLGSGKYPISGGLKAVVKGKSIVSVVN